MRPMPMPPRQQQQAVVHPPAAKRGYFRRIHKFRVARGTQSLVAAGSAWTSAGDGTSAAKAIGGLEPASGAAAAGKGAQALNWRRAAAPNSGGPAETKSAPPSGAVPTGGDLKGSIGDWDQFSANESKFNIKARYDENLYTTKLDTSNIDRKKWQEAERIAKEIEGTVTKNIHLAEERNQKVETEYDEEDLYSGVLTTNKKDGSEKAKKGGKVMNFAAAAKKGTDGGTGASAPTTPSAAAVDASGGGVSGRTAYDGG